jgi:hypothetical protein
MVDMGFLSPGILGVLPFGSKSAVLAGDVHSKQLTLRFSKRIPVSCFLSMVCVDQKTVHSCIPFLQSRPLHGKINGFEGFAGVF